jgi:hypothetical protein
LRRAPIRRSLSVTWLYRVEDRPSNRGGGSVLSDGAYSGRQEIPHGNEYIHHPQFQVSGLRRLT